MYWDAELIRRWSGHDVDLTRPMPSDLIMAAMNEALEKVRAGQMQQLTGLAGGLNIPGLDIPGLT